ncbi:hypothetical protein GUY44_20565 [Pimelobacter simplex]|uniref:hypothetical protein n=1 Tax=Nocardioides simplex TaxID=2045 RepID=UPI000535B436|nr:hypothetical protein [Pimelobacter simplex]MCG8152887.1 hypothetical protein [Pimelobacter simplex]GEB11856.1 hypothetical protein NSI01_01710 [Pimelobacter simplex]SFN02657.1 hypothetical protein SAMN05421671_4716 [Pimelobacter simplex]
MADEATQERGARIDWPATFAGAAAAVTVAVLLSTLGAAGTLIGAALGSIIATVSSALYKQGIESSRRRMADVQAAALQRVNLADQNVRRAARRSDPEAAERELDRAHRHLDAASSDLEDAEPSRWAQLPWKKLALLAALVFVIAIVVISLVELIAGKSVSTITGGTDGSDRTSLTGIFGDRTDDSRDRDRQQPTDDATPTGPTDAPTTGPSDPGTAPTDATTGPTGPTEAPTTGPTDPGTAPSGPDPGAGTPTPTPTPTPNGAPAVP